MGIDKTRESVEEIESFEVSDRNMPKKDILKLLPTFFTDPEFVKVYDKEYEKLVQNKISIFNLNKIAADTRAMTFNVIGINFEEKKFDNFDSVSTTLLDDPREMSEFILLVLKGNPGLLHKYSKILQMQTAIDNLKSQDSINN